MNLQSLHHASWGPAGTLTIPMHLEEGWKTTTPGGARETKTWKALEHNFCVSQILSLYINAKAIVLKTHSLRPKQTRQEKQVSQMRGKNTFKNNNIIA